MPDSYGGGGGGEEQGSTCTDLAEVISTVFIYRPIFKFITVVYHGKFPIVPRNPNLFLPIQSESIKMQHFSMVHWFKIRG